MKTFEEIYEEVMKQITDEVINERMNADDAVFDRPDPKFSPLLERRLNEDFAAMLEDAIAKEEGR